MREVAPERTSWRDLRLNARHRQWDFHCPAVDVDMLMLEYTSGRVCALVEYKNEQATTQDMSHASYRALVDLGNRAEVPVFFVRYATNFSWFRVYPMNLIAVEYIEHDYIDLSEADYVRLMYTVRGGACPITVLEQLNAEQAEANITPDTIDWAVRNIRASEWKEKKGYPFKRAS